MSRVQADQKAAPAGAENDDEDELVVIEADDEGDKKPARPDADEDDGDEGDERLGGRQEDDPEADAEREAIRARRREEKRAQREKRRQAEARTKRENDALRRALEQTNARLAAIEGQSLQAQARDVDARLSGTVQRYNEAKRVYEQAVNQGNGALAVRAQEEMIAAERANAHFRDVKQRLHPVASRPEASQQDDAPDPRVLELAQDFASRNKWYDPSGEDEDSVILQAIDQKLAREGFDPADEDYWVELERRAAKRMPHRFKAAGERKSGPPVGSGREYAPASTRNEVYVSKERKDALIAAGKWNDPVKRKAALKAYARFDRENPTR